ncbi:MAG TPA: 30S ribosomal protein S16 [Kiritimatiellia bacterium]|nr:30S ribosomal protein S16 [Kiritimatiellia bacterium]HMP00115.1 30S ribosomal protein S16 [Kiritimatiellia bacterium]HMP96576.1 30S ribosomal protein S16 [Kiritimatiellia bacterium]
MSISIRLKKMGKKDQPFYRVVVSDTLKKHEGAYLENLGWYDPLASGDNYLLKTDRIEYWMSQGARVSDTVTSLLRRNRKRLRNAPAEAEAAAAPGA